MRVVAGRYKGRRLHAPPGRATRPTADRVRGSLFQLLGSLDGMRVLDLFAGSGALAIEALSRGAAHAVLVDSDPRALAVARRNLELVEGSGELHRRDAVAFLRDWTGDPFDLVLLDPPYSSGGRLAGSLAEHLPHVLTDSARIVTESDKRAPLPLELPLVDERVYGDTRIAIHRGS